MTVLFADVSYHDWDRRGGALDWTAIAAAGLGGVMCARATYGDPAGFNPPSPRFPEYMAGARAAGFVARGAYHNLIRGDQASINRQVDLLRFTMDANGATWAMADIEAYPELVTRGLVADWATVQRFHDRWYQVEPSTVMAWYIGRGFWSGNLGSHSLTGLRGPLIGPRYPGVTGAPASAYTAAGGDAGNGWAAYGGRMPDIWQYSSTVTVPGASSKTDVNAFRGSLTALVALLTGQSKGDEAMAFLDDQNARYVAYRTHDWAEMVETVTNPWGEVITHKGVTAIKAIRADVAAVRAAAAEDQTRDAAMLAAINALAAQIQAGGGSVDVAAITAAIRAEAATTRGLVEQLQAALAAKEDELRQALAGEVRDAVADLGEGGATQVRADA